MTTEDIPGNLAKVSPALFSARAFYDSEIAAINPTRAERLAAEMAASTARHEIDACEDWGSEERAFVPYFLLLNSINFMFWRLGADGALVRYEAWGAQGSVAMSRGMRMFFHAVERIWRDSHVSEEDAHRLVAENFDSCFPGIPNRDTRIKMILDVAGSPSRLRSACRSLSHRVHSRGMLTPVDILLLVESFPVAFGVDPFCKRSQLALMMIAARYSEYGRTIPVRGFTVASDYQLPKVLRAEGVISYSPTLSDMVDKGKKVDAGSVEELAIRAATVLSCELLRELSALEMPSIDHWLWARREKYPGTRFHLTETTDY
jgi:hypothetical protein